jgi:uncharacterized phiE125 gp8 family phage protein
VSLTLVTPPPEPPIGVYDLRAHLRIDEADEDALLESYIEAARLHLEGPRGWLNRALLTQTWDWTLDCFPLGPGRVFHVPLPPLQSVASITYLDADAIQQTLAPSAYVVDTRTEPGRIQPVSSTSWPTTYAQFNAVTVRFVAGFGPVQEDIPQPIRQALIGLASDYYEHRDTDAAPPRWIDILLTNQRVWV